MTDAARTIIDGGHWGVFALDSGQCATITNLEGTQVVDCWALNRHDPGEFLSNEHTRSCLQKLVPQLNDSLYSNRRCPILTITEDSSPGVHDLLLSACDEQRYALLGHVGYHRNCADNYREALNSVGVQATELPSPFNIFEHVTIADGGVLAIDTPPVQAGDYITLRAEMNVYVILSVCPMDLALTNGPDGRTKPVAVEIRSDLIDAAGTPT